VTAAPVAAPRAADFLARNRGGGLFTETVNQRIAAYLCVVAHRLGLAPTILTLGNLVLGVGASVLVILSAEGMADGRVSAPAVGLGALVLWHIAYSLDCADGQLARVTGRAGPAGQRVDILSDVALQIGLVAAVTSVAHAFSPRLPAWLMALFAGTWMVNLITSVLAQGSASGSLITSRSMAVRLVKLIRDYGAMVTVVGLVLAFVPGWSLGLMIAFTVVNGAFLLASVGAAARASLRPQ